MLEGRLARWRSMGLSTILAACTAGCSGEVGVSEEVQDFEQDQLIEAEEARASDRAVEAIQGSVQDKVQMSDEAAASLEVAVMPNVKMLAGAKDPATGLCFVLGSKQSTWTVFAMGSAIEDSTVMAMGQDYGDGTVGSTVDVDELGRWAQANCTPEGKAAVQ